MHTFGRDLKWNPHIHMLLTEGASGNKTIWKRVSHIPFNMLRKRWQATILSFLHKKLGPSFYSLKSYLFKNYPKDFYVYAKKYTHSSKLYLLDSTTKKHFRKKHSHWRARLLLAFGVDPLCCSCGKTMELVGVFRFGGNPYIENISSSLYNST